LLQDRPKLSHHFGLKDIPVGPVVSFAMVFRANGNDVFKGVRPLVSQGDDVVCLNVPIPPRHQEPLRTTVFAGSLEPPDHVGPNGWISLKSRTRFPDPFRPIRSDRVIIQVIQSIGDGVEGHV